MIKKRINILLVDDHPMVRSGLKLMLEQQKLFNPIITEAENGLEALEQLLTKKYDIVLLDINLPKLDGISVIKQCKAKNIDTPILAITMHNEEHVVKQVVAAGALGYIIKNCGIEELTKAIKTVLSRKKYYSNEVAQSLIAKTDRKRKTDKTNKILFNRLTEREKVVIKLIAQELTNQEIADSLNLSSRTIEGHRARILAKLEVKNTVGLIRFALDNNLLD